MKIDPHQTSIGIELDSKTAFFLGVLAGRHNLLQYAKEWVESNPHHVIAEWAKEHPEKIAEAWGKDNLKQEVSAWVDANPEKVVHLWFQQQPGDMLQPLATVSPATAAQPDPAGAVVRRRGSRA